MPNFKTYILRQYDIISVINQKTQTIHLTSSFWPVPHEFKYQQDKIAFPKRWRPRMASLSHFHDEAMIHKSHEHTRQAKKVNEEVLNKDFEITSLPVWLHFVQLQQGRRTWSIHRQFYHNRKGNPHSRDKRILRKQFPLQIKI